jgi:NitT/TauT family transport system substrate-binding protein
MGSSFATDTSLKKSMEGLKMRIPVAATIRTRRIGIAAASLLALLNGSPLMAAELKKVRLAFTSFTIEQLPYQLAAEKGFFLEEGLAPEFIYMRATTITMALASQDILYASAASSAIHAAVTGIAARVLWVASSKTLMFLMTKPEIKQISDLKGKRIGVSGIGGASDIGVRALLGAYGVNPREATIIAIGPTDARLLALKAGAIDATPLISPRNFQAEAMGFRTLGFVGDYMPNAFGGFSVHNVALDREPKLVEALVRIGLKGLRVMKQDKVFTLRLMQQFTKIQDKELASRTYDANIGYFTSDGILPEKEQRDILEEARKQFKVTKAIPMGIFDFGLTRKINRELGDWKP